MPTPLMLQNSLFELPKVYSILTASEERVINTQEFPSWIIFLGATVCRCHSDVLPW